MLLMLAMISYGVTVIAAALGFSGLARGASPLMRYFFGGFLAVTIILIVIASLFVRHGV